jgi:hypothetical protein
MPLSGRGKKIEKEDIDEMLLRRDVDGLCEVLRCKDVNVRRVAAEALGEIGDARAVDPLIKALQIQRFTKWNYRYFGLRAAAAEALGEIGDARAVDPLIKALQDVREVQDVAAAALGRIGDARAVDPLIKALQEENFDRRIAAEALGEIGDARAVDPLIKALQEGYFEKKAAAEALGKIGDARAVDPLIRALRNGGFEKEAAAEALGKIDGARATEALRLYFSTRTFVEKNGFAPKRILSVRDSPNDSAIPTIRIGNLEISENAFDELFGERSRRADVEEKEVQKASKLSDAQKLICSECGEEIPDAVRYEPPDLTMRCSGVARQCSCGWTCCMRCDPTYDQPDNGHDCPRCGRRRSGWVQWDPHRNMVDRSGWTQIDGETDHWFKGGLWKKWKEDRESDRWTTIRRDLAKRLNL